jgi:hypothetical protein
MAFRIYKNKLMRTLPLLMLVLTVPAVAQDGVISFESDPGHWVGAGEDVVIEFANEHAFFDLTDSGSAQLILQQPGHPNLSIQFAAAGFDSNLKTGCYERARRLREHDRPAFDIGYDARGCNLGLSRFVLHELEADANLAITKLSMDFAHHCELGGPSLRGHVRFHSDFPVADGSYDPVFKTVGELNVISDPLDVVGAGEMFSIPFSEQSFSTWRTSFFGRDNELILENLGQTPRSWSLMFRGPVGEPFAPGPYNTADSFLGGEPELPGLCFGLDSWGCSADFGSFEIEQLVRDPIDRYPIDGAVRFDRTIFDNENEIFTWVRGNATFHTQIRSGPLVPDVIFLDGHDEYQKWPLYWPCT